MLNYKEDCRLCTAYYREAHEILYEDNFCYIIPTIKMKGHNKRIMVVAKEHRHRSRHEQILLDTFKSFCKIYFDEEPTCIICEPMYASITDHCHFVACDWKTNDKKELQQMMYTPHVCIKTNVEWKP